MKTKVEINGYEIEIEFINGVITVKAEKDDEVIEEFSIETEESDDSEGGEDVQSFGDFDEEEDFEGQGQDEDEDEFEGQDEDEDEFEGQDEEEMTSALESFQSFINKKRK
jgi:hypothetical protein